MRRRRWAQADAGFTLVEVLTVLVLAAAMLGLAAPRFTTMLDEMRLDQATGRLVREFHFAQAGALARGRRTEVWIERGGYRIVGGGVDTITVTLPIGVHVDKTVSARAISFSPAGASSGGYVILQSRTGRRTIIVPAVWGVARIMPEELR